MRSCLGAKEPGSRGFCYLLQALWVMSRGTTSSLSPPLCPWKPGWVVSSLQPSTQGPVTHGSEMPTCAPASQSPARETHLVPAFSLPLATQGTFTAPKCLQKKGLFHSAFRPVEGVFIHKDVNSVYWVSAEHAFLTQSSQPPNYLGVTMIINPSLQMGKLRSREVK